ncbi:hypothetical protein VP01_4874g1 [Puccinia sorghi]|uniref:Uncharacterized protein n=1 Tax=Puccinia sorghi TaxID=27349 RepID=A0A0L6UM97_9BASI|nr:hypothetical protein VP01_4874g1 [Puccinia sorghi]
MEIKSEDLNLVRTHKKNTGKFHNEMKTELLCHLNHKSAFWILVLLI